MILINIAIFLSISAIIIGFLKPKSKSSIWLISLLAPIVLAFVIALIEASFSESTLSYPNKLAWSIGGNFISIIISIPTLLFCLKKKLVKLANGEQYKFPKGLIIAIIILFSVGLLSEWGIYNRQKTEEKTEVDGLVSREKARRIVKENVESTKKILPITQAGFSFTDVYIKDNAFTSYFIVDDNELNFDDYINHIEKYKSDYFMQSTGHNPEFVNNLLLSGYDWTIIIEAKNSGKKKVLNLLAKDLRDAVNNK